LTSAENAAAALTWWSVRAVSFHFGHVPHHAVQGHQGCADRLALTPLVVEAVALEQQRGPVILQPALEHGPLGRAERRVDGAGTGKTLSHGQRR